MYTNMRVDCSEKPQEEKNSNNFEKLLKKQKQKQKVKPKLI